MNAITYFQIQIQTLPIDKRQQKDEGAINASNLEEQDKAGKKDVPISTTSHSRCLRIASTGL